MAGGCHGKMVRHGCGYRLSTRVIGVLEWGDEVVVEYRDEAELVVSMCPGCSQPLKLWWLVPDGVSHVVDEMRSFVAGRGTESEVGQ